MRQITLHPAHPFTTRTAEFNFSIKIPKFEQCNYMSINIVFALNGWMSELKGFSFVLMGEVQSRGMDGFNPLFGFTFARAEQGTWEIRQKDKQKNDSKRWNQSQEFILHQFNNDIFAFLWMHFVSFPFLFFLSSSTIILLPSAFASSFAKPFFSSPSAPPSSQELQSFNCLWFLVQIYSREMNGSRTKSGNNSFASSSRLFPPAHLRICALEIHSRRAAWLQPVIASTFADHQPAEDFSNQWIFCSSQKKSSKSETKEKNFVNVSSIVWLSSILFPFFLHS